MITQAELKNLFYYDPITGIFIWRLTRQGVNIGQPAGSINSDGYRIICVDGRYYTAGRLAWLWMKGKWPERDIDHIDTDPSNNRWNNLRLATISQNAGNRKKAKNNTSGFKGVCMATCGRWVARICINGRRFHLGYFDTAANAHKAYVAAAEKYFGEFARAA